MKKHAVSYAIIRFQPHVETEEFANIGIVLVAPRLSFLDFRIETRRIGRITNFFDTVEHAKIRTILRHSHDELKRIKDLSGHKGDGQTRFEFELSDNAEHLFLALTKDREGVIRFSDVRFAMTDNPRRKIDELFDYYVRRNFAGSIYKEGLLERHVRSVLRMREIGKNFKKKEFSDGVYSATFPFVEISDQKPIKILKPIYLGQEDPTRIIDHSNKWIFTINRLRNFLPKDVVFAVEGPKGNRLQGKAFSEATEQLRLNNITVVDARNEVELVGAIQ
ncbi:MAG: DUF3037 domain-containing protein [Aquamicrobium sp.]|uniref:DUF3037 domain-containing protein n=1 Tax=Mesorhizobium sp. Pch-S TaxID=2082387 RepID=UPI001010C4E0|nr:DUF3037 domain-containing protein [Mesorhizobium sp. Pch-S]MBR2692045.1 DUF3037 domain-containing protein [Aquamicrobium sp.]QAZ42594.1 DUF3037 domain-containing protein [Mesorhizobium sp. Pch-S]